MPQPPAPTIRFLVIATNSEGAKEEAWCETIDDALAVAKDYFEPGANGIAEDVIVTITNS